MPNNYLRDRDTLVSGTLPENLTTPLPADIVVPKLTIPANSSANFKVDLSTAYTYVIVGVRGMWSATTWRIQIQDAQQRSIQTAPARGPLVVGSEAMTRSFEPMFSLPGGASLTGTVWNDGGAALDLDLLFVAIALS